MKAYDSRLRQLAKHVDLENPEAVKAFVATRDTWSNAFKESVSKSYDQYVRMNVTGSTRWSFIAGRLCL